eukprot:s4214_g2.t1
MRPFVEQFRDRVPSGFFVADVFLMLDKLWMGRLLIPVEQGDSKQSLASDEAKKIKLLIGALRGLWREENGAEEGAGENPMNSDDEDADEVQCDDMHDGESVRLTQVKDDSDHDGVDEPVCESQHSPGESEASTLVLPGLGDEVDVPVPGSPVAEGSEGSGEPEGSQGSGEPELASQGSGEAEVPKLSDSECSGESPVAQTPECSQPPVEDCFNTPDGDHPKHFSDAELTELCISLLQYIGQTHPDIARMNALLLPMAVMVIAAIEVLCKTQAFVVKRVAPGGGDKCRAGQVSWKKSGGAMKAWELAQELANWH